MERYTVGSSAKAARRRLEAAGFDPAQAEALLYMIGDSQEELATKQDLASAQGALTQDIAEVRTDLRNLAMAVAANTARIDALERAMEALRQEVRDRFESFRQEMAGQMDGLRGQMDGLRGEMRAIKWMIGAMLATMVPMVGGIIALALR